MSKKRPAESAFKKLRERKEQAKNVVGLDSERQARRHRLVSDPIKDHQAIIWPAPDYPNGETQVDISYLLKFPNLNTPFTQALLGLGKERNLELSSLSSMVNHLKLGFCKYLEATKLNELSLSGITTTLLNGFINFLNQEKDGEAAWDVSTREGRIVPLRGIHEWLKRSSEWSGALPQDSQLRKNIWAGQKRSSKKTTPVIPWDDYALIYQACIREITQIMNTVTEMRKRMLEKLNDPVAMKPEPKERTITPRNGTTKNPYRDLGVTLATLKHRYPMCDMYRSVVEDATDRALKNAIEEYHGGIVAVGNCFYPTSRGLIPFAIMMGIHFDYNLETLLGSKIEDYGFKTNQFGRGELIVTPEDLTENGERVKSNRRFIGDAQKKRAHGKAQHRVLPDTDEFDNPARIVKFLLEWTANLRSVVDMRFRNRLFLFSPKGAYAPRSYQGKSSACSDSSWELSYKAFFKENKLPYHPYRTFRATGLDITEILFKGDLRAKNEAANHRLLDTTYSQYTTAGQMARGDEVLAEVGQTRKRWRESQGKIDPRSKPEGVDLGAATPGWICIDPYDAPNGKRDELCGDYGKCPDCPNGFLQVSDSYSVAQAWNLLAAIDDAAEELSGDAWIERWAPVRERLLNYWLPQVPKPIAVEARTIKMHKLPPLE